MRSKSKVLPTLLSHQTVVSPRGSRYVSGVQPWDQFSLAVGRPSPNPAPMQRLSQTSQLGCCAWQCFIDKQSPSKLRSPSSVIPSVRKSCPKTQVFLSLSSLPPPTRFRFRAISHYIQPPPWTKSPRKARRLYFVALFTVSLQLYRCVGQQTD